MKTFLEITRAGPESAFALPFDPATLWTPWTIASNVAQAAQIVSADNFLPITGLDLSSLPKVEGIDLHYQSIGKTTLKEGESLFVELAKSKST